MKLRVKRIAAMLSLAVIAAGAVAPFIWVKGDAVIPGVRVNGIAAGGKTRAELTELFRQKNEELAGEKLALTKDTAQEEWTFRDLGVRYDEKSLDEAMAIGRTGSLFARWEERWKALLSGKSAHVDAAFDEKAVDSKVASLTAKYGKPAQNAYPRFHNDGSITFSEGRPYLKVDGDALKEDVRETLAAGEGKTIEIPASEEKKPNMSPADAKEINSILGKYTTHFGPDRNRSDNIHLAAEKISGTYLKPGGDFSYNGTTGSRSAANGYKEAPVIINGKLEPGSGGGVCQVSSTLFNAVLLSGLEVTQRTSHFSPVSYVPLGRDATVAEGIIDFRFRNHLKHGIYIYTEYAPGSVTVFILGNKEDRPSYVDLSKTKDDTLPFKTVNKVDPAQKEDKKVDEGYEGRNVTIKQSVKWADGRVYHDLFESDYEAVDTVVTYKNPEDVPKE